MAGSSTSVESLHSDITSLIESAKKRFAENPFDEEAQKRLKALLDLQNIIKTQQLPPAQLAMVKDQLYKLARPSPPPVPTPPPVLQPPPPPPPPPQPTQVSMPLQAASLAALLSGFGQQHNAMSNTQVPMTQMPQMPQMPQMSQMPIPPPPPPQPFGNDAASLLASLRSVGLIGGPGNGLTIPPPPRPPSIPAVQPMNMNPAVFLGGMVPVPRSMIQTPPPPPPPPLQQQSQAGANNWRSIDVELKTTSLK